MITGIYYKTNIKNINKASKINKTDNISKAHNINKGNNINKANNINHIHNTNYIINTIKSPINIIKILSILILAVFILVPNTVQAKEETVYKDGNYCYHITNEIMKEVTLIGIENNESMKELNIPGKATINGKEYTVSKVDILWNYHSNESYQDFYNNVTKLNIEDTFSGSLIKPLYAFPNVTTIEFYGKETLPKEVIIETSNRKDNLDILFIVPIGMEKEYAKIVDEVMFYSMYSDLYEHEIPMVPTIVTSETRLVEYGCFQIDGFIYQVTKSAKDGVGEVQLIGISKMLDKSYISLSEIVKNQNFSYKLTKLCKFGLVGSMAKVIRVPDSVTKMDSSLFDKNLELLFLSKNCKVIPGWLITDENSESNLRFVSIPEGVTTLSDNAFNFFNMNQSSIILPKTVKTLGKKAVYGCELVTFLNKKPINNITSAIKNGTTVKVDKSVITKYKALLSKKVIVTAAKNIVKSTKLTVNATSLNMVKETKKVLKGTLSKGSNETIYWLSSDQNILSVSSKGVVSAKYAGTAYVIAYTRTSGLYKVVKVTVN
jgi:hypothetical protein